MEINVPQASQKIGLPAFVAAFFDQLEGFFTGLLGFAQPPPLSFGGQLQQDAGEVAVADARGMGLVQLLKNPNGLANGLSHFVHAGALVIDILQFLVLGGQLFLFSFPIQGFDFGEDFFFISLEEARVFLEGGDFVFQLLDFFPFFFAVQKVLGLPVILFRHVEFFFLQMDVAQVLVIDALPDDVVRLF